MMLAAAVYLSLMGKQGVQEAAKLCLHKSHYLADEIQKIKGFGLKYSQPFFKEFLVETPIPAKDIINRLSEKDIQPGIDISRFDNLGDGLLVAVTEKRTKEEMDKFVSELKSL
jgi:glycine dehydrogenase subunit 1